MLPMFSYIRRAPHGFLSWAKTEFGDVVQFPIPRPPTYLVGDWQGTRHVLVDNAPNYDTDTIQYRSLSLVTGDGLLSVSGDQWRTQRQHIQPAFHRNHLDGLANITEAHTHRAVQKWLRAPGPVEMQDACDELALGILLEALFGGEIPGTADLVAGTRKAVDVIIRRARSPFAAPGWVPTSANRQLTSALATLDAAAATLVNAGGPLTELLASATSEITPAQATKYQRDQIVTFLVAGHETVATALAWTLTLLASAPKWQQPDAGGQARRGLIDESLRLFPPAWVLTRRARADDEIGGYLIPAGSLVILSPLLVHRDGRVWSNPLSLDPRRSHSRTDAFLPFGLGQRICVGRDFSYLELDRALEVIMATVRLATTPDWEFPQTDAGVTLRPKGGLWLDVQPRTG